MPPSSRPPPPSLPRFPHDKLRPSPYSARMKKRLPVPVAPSCRCLFRLLAALPLAGLLAGCGTFSRYPAGMNQVVLGPMDGGADLHPAVAELSSRMEGRDEALFAVETGRTAQLYGDYATSRAAFEKAIARTDAQDYEGVLAPKAAAQQASAILVNDKAIEYRPPDYERTLMHHYQALNYLGAQDLDGAGVEIRRANRVQEEARKRHEAETDKAAGKARKNDSAASEDPLADAPDATRQSIDKVYAGLNELAGQVKTSFQNAATFFLSAVVWEMRGEPNDAYIDYKKALEMAPGNPALQAAVIRLGKRLGMREDVDAFSRRFPSLADMPADGSSPLAGKGHLVVIVEEGHVAQKDDLSIPYPVSEGIGMISIPLYHSFPAQAGSIRLSVDGRPVSSFSPICRVSSLAARALSERMPGIIARQTARAVAKGVALSAARKNGGGDAAVVLLSIYNVASEQADLRSWLTLPDVIQAADAWTAPGSRTVRLQWTGGGNLELPVTVAAGKTTLLYVTRADWSFYSHAFVQP